MSIEITLGDLARIALGTTSFGPNNIAVLHSLIDLLLKKLGCRDEKVKIGGFESNFLKAMLKRSEIPAYSFRDNNMELLTEKFQLMSDLQKRLQTLQERMDKHNAEIEQCNKDTLGKVYEFQNWETYVGICEDLCEVREPSNALGCELLQNADFMKKLLRRVTFPLIRRLFKFENRVDLLHQDFTIFMRKTSSYYMKMALIERCIEGIEQLQREVDDNYSKFLLAMEEIQDLLDAKLDKKHMPALKKYVRERFNTIQSMLEVFKTEKDCDENNFIMGDIKCLSCGNKSVCVEKRADTKAPMPGAWKKTEAKFSKKHCSCRSQPGDRVTMMDLPSTNGVGELNLDPPSSRPKQCDESKYVLRRGTNQLYFRMAKKEKSEDM